MKLSKRQAVVVALILVSVIAMFLTTALPSITLVLYLIAFCAVVAALPLEIAEYLPVRGTEQAARSVHLTNSVMTFMIAFALVWIGLSISVLPKYWVALAIAAVSFGIAAYYQFRAHQGAAQPESAPWLFVAFGATAVALAVGMWVSPPPTPTPPMWLGLLSGVLLGGILLAVSRSRKST